MSSSGLAAQLLSLTILMFLWPCSP